MVLADKFYEYLERGRCEYGGWGLDDKRPFGNSYVAGDIMEFLGLPNDEMVGSEQYDEQIDYVDSLYDDLGSYLKEEWYRLRDLER